MDETELYTWSSDSTPPLSSPKTLSQDRADEMEECHSPDMFDECDDGSNWPPLSLPVEAPAKVELKKGPLSLPSDFKQTAEVATSVINLGSLPSNIPQPYDCKELQSQVKVSTIIILLPLNGISKINMEGLHLFWIVKRTKLTYLITLFRIVMVIKLQLMCLLLNVFFCLPLFQSLMGQMYLQNLWKRLRQQQLLQTKRKKEASIWPPVYHQMSQNLTKKQP